MTRFSKRIKQLFGRDKAHNVEDCSIEDCALCAKANADSLTYELENMDGVSKEEAREVLKKLEADIKTDTALRDKLKQIVGDGVSSDSKPLVHLSSRDAATVDENMIYAPGELGKTRKTTPEGFLLCEGVRIARTGEQVYAHNELPLDPKDGMIIVERPASEVFRKETLASFEGKPVTVEHPNNSVTPETWKQLAVGTVHNVRQGEGLEDENVLADLLIHDQGAITYVNTHMPELSCGYDSDYEQTEPGRAIQHNIIGNHVALVTRARAGPRFAIRDHQSIHQEDTTMAKVKVIDRLLGLINAVKLKDQKTLDALLTMDEEEGEAVGAMDAKALDARISDAVDRAMKARDERGKEKTDEEKGAEEKESKAESEKEDKKVKEAEKESQKDGVLSPETLAKNPDLFGRTWVGDAAAPIMKEIVTRSEILSPGISIPTTDSVSQSSVKNFMLSVLSRCMTTDAGRAVVTPFLFERTLDSLSGQELFGVFNGAAELMRTRNNGGQRQGTALKTRDFGKETTVADIQKANDDFWSKRRA